MVPAFGITAIATYSTPTHEPEMQTVWLAGFNDEDRLK